VSNNLNLAGISETWPKLPKWHYIPPQLLLVEASFTMELLPNKVKLRSVCRHQLCQ